MELVEKIEACLEAAEKNKERLTQKCNQETDANVKDELLRKIENVQKWGIEFNNSILARVLDGSPLSTKQLEIFERNCKFYLEKSFVKKPSDPKVPSFPPPSKNFADQMKIDENGAMTKIASSNMMLALTKVYDYLPDNLKPKAEELKREYLKWQMTQSDNGAVAAQAKSEFTEFEMPF